MKKTIYGTAAREAFIQAAKELCDPVKITLGPKGKNVIISPLGGMAFSTKDGVTVAGEVEHENQAINACIKIIRQAARKTVEEAGDGTTTATVLANALLIEINQRLINGESILLIKEALAMDLQFCREFIKANAIPLVKDGVVDVEKIMQIATISANNDEAIGLLFKEAYDVIGAQGIILLDESKQAKTYIESVKGMRQDFGLASPFFMNQQGGCLLEDAVVFVTDKNLTQQKDILMILDYAHKKQVPLVVFSQGMTGEALSFFAGNIQRGTVKGAAICIPNWKKGFKDYLKDIAAYAGATFFSEDIGHNLDNLTPQDVPHILGNISRFQATHKDCILIGGNGKDTVITDRVEDIDSQITPELSDRDREDLLARKSKLLGGVAILYAGGQTEVERKETVARCEDAILAVRSALEEGYLPGGGKVHLALAKNLNINILVIPLISIITQICENAGADSYDIIYKKLDKEESLIIGYNAKTGVIEDLLAAGVVDSAKVIRSSLESAVSIASVFLNTDCLIVEEKAQ